MSADFLVELGTEELPPKALKNLMASFAETIEANLKAAELSFTAIKPFAAPRRRQLRAQVALGLTMA